MMKHWMAAALSAALIAAPVIAGAPLKGVGGGKKTTSAQARQAPAKPVTKPAAKTQPKSPAAKRKG